SGSPNLFDRSLSDLKETDKDPSSRDTVLPLCAASITFAIGVTVALILHVFLVIPQVFVEGVVVSDHVRCTSLGQTVLNDGGSSVDAAVTAALCLGVVHPHVSGVGGGGVMLVHDLHRKETRVIDFQGTAPKALKEVMLQNVSGLKAGLRVGVPGLLRGLHHAHSLYGSLLWEDVVTRAAAVAEDGFNVSFSLAEAISKVQGEHLSQRFRDTFLPGGRPLLPGSFLRMSSLAAVLRGGLSNFYDGNFSLEMEDEVQTNGGVLSRDDISNYSVEVGQPLEGLYNVPPPSSAGAALISALKLLEGLQLNGNNDTENQTHHWIAEAVKGALAKARGLGDASLNSSVTELLSDLLSSHGARWTHGVNCKVMVRGCYLCDGCGTCCSAHTDIPLSFILCLCDLSSLSTPFGSRLMTVSGVILNGLILDFYWPDKTPGRRSSNQKNPVQPGARPQTPLMPTIVVPARHKCGLYTALSSSGGPRSLSVVTQVLIRALSLNKERNESLSLGRLHSNRQPSRRLDYPEFPEESVQFEKGRVKMNAVFQGIQRDNDIITPITP
uniref:Glutathione hydrolase n=1 Tax=Gasterosteus aculeatus aculeatus TaxID=481459 RepID=G3P745_GASAC